MTYRRLTGPTLVSLALAALVADYLYFRDSQWSIVALLSKIGSVFVKIFGPALNPSLYGWLDRFLLPVAVILFVFVLLGLIIALAKNAMREATENFEGDVSVYKHASASLQPSTAPESDLPSARRRKPRLAWKLSFSFGALALTFGAVAGVLTYAGISREFHKAFKHRAGLTVMVLTEIARRDDRADTEAELQRALENQAANRSIAYIYVEDAAGQIIAHVPRDLPRFLGSELRKIAVATDGGESEYRGLPVFRIVEPVPGVRRGYVHLAMWQNASEAYVREAMLPIVASVFLLVWAGWAVFGWIARRLMFPFRELARYANRLSHGELDLDLTIAEKSEEIQDLARSFSRMRSSLYAVLIRMKNANRVR